MNSVNPFQIKTPENLAPEEAVNLFVDVFTDYQKIIAQGHTFIMGPRGIGKSMIFRYLEPDCQCIKSQYSKTKIDELEFLGLYIPLRNAGFTKITELTRLEMKIPNGIAAQGNIIMKFFCLEFLGIIIKLIVI